MITVTLLGVVLAVALVVGCLVLMRLAATRADRDGYLRARATTRLGAAARAITGLYVEVAEPGVRPRCGRRSAAEVMCRTGSDASGGTSRIGNGY